eukprot:21325-Amphidinium_carterae.1
MPHNGINKEWETGVFEENSFRCRAFFFPKLWRSDREVVLTAVGYDGRALQFAAEALRGDREIVLKALRERANALQAKSDSFGTLEVLRRFRGSQVEALRADREVVLSAVQRNGNALQHATLRGDREVALAAVQQDGRAL